MSDLGSTSDKSVNGTSLYGSVEGLGWISLMARKVYISSNTYFLSELESAPANGTSFEGLEQMSRVAAYIYTTHTLCPTWTWS